MRRVMVCLPAHFFLAMGGFAQLVQPADFQYLGAFRLPEGSNGSDWNYSGYGAAYYPEGDPKGPNDGYPGYKTASIGDCCYDRARNILYLFERRADEDKSLVHAWKIRSAGTSGSCCSTCSAGRNGSFPKGISKPATM